MLSALVWTDAEVTDTVGRQGLSSLSIIFRFHSIDSSVAGDNGVVLLAAPCLQYLILSNHLYCVCQSLTPDCHYHYAQEFVSLIFHWPTWRLLIRSSRSTMTCIIAHPLSRDPPDFRYPFCSGATLNDSDILHGVAAELGHGRPIRVDIRMYSVWRFGFSSHARPLQNRSSGCVYL